MAESIPYGFILERPLVAIAGRIGGQKRVTLYMHEGFDRPGIHPLALCERVANWDAGDYLVWGDLSLPAAFWPIYAKVS